MDPCTEGPWVPTDVLPDLARSREMDPPVAKRRATDEPANLVFDIRPRMHTLSS
ncbi:MAG: hypothetical protein AVDCRST_MAG55-935 [uncultured Rubrobacteraceae bacterium]|uniref:Uncharacterized protein n=1 Tax=uncultured Rubrobacteraceae bacterium TaxID=349277 RepID=A0A6J4P9R6_9ACTN|nr:MAG: hypothetical protein AVDCRST_MAG55-935 [uncultured Rubrobacteraceae bacterium]